MKSVRVKIIEGDYTKRYYAHVEVISSKKFFPIFSKTSLDEIWKDIKDFCKQNGYFIKKTQIL